MADYAIVIMAAAARQCGRRRISAGDIAERTGIPAPTVQKLVSRLTSAGLLRSVRGVGGGLHLARPAAAISVADIVEAVEGPIALTSCVGEGRHDCTLEQACSMKPALAGGERRLARCARIGESRWPDPGSGPRRSRGMNEQTALKDQAARDAADRVADYEHGWST